MRGALRMSIASSTAPDCASRSQWNAPCSNPLSLFAAISVTGLPSTRIDRIA